MQNLTVRFMGTSTVSFDDGRTAILIDGFFSRPSVKQMFGTIKPDEKRIDRALQNARIRKLAAVFVAHSHHDHALDSATVARKTGARLYGSRSTRNIALGEGFPKDRIEVFKDGQNFAFGAFRVTVFRTPHSPGGFFKGSIAKPLDMPARVSEYREGGNYSFLVTHRKRRILVVTSAGKLARGRFRSVRAGTVFLSIGKLGKQSDAFAEHYWREAVLATRAKLVLPVHWDNFARGLDKPLKQLGIGDDIDNARKTLGRLAERDGVELRFPAAFEPIDVVG